MDSAEKRERTEPSPEGSEDKTDAPQRLARFAQYTSPAMLALLVSTGKTYAGS
jgi:hypothetical protein